MSIKKNVQIVTLVAMAGALAATAKHKPTEVEIMTSQLSVEQNKVYTVGTSDGTEVTIDTVPVSGLTEAMMATVGEANRNVEVDEDYINQLYEELYPPEPVITDVSYTRYVTDILNIRSEPNTDSEVLGKFVVGNEVEVTGEVEDNDFVRITYKNQDAFIHSDYLSEEKPEVKEVIEFTWSGAVLNSVAGTVQGPSGKETYYNLPMGGVVSIMRSRGFSESDYPYWVRSDGCKMLGPYIMVAADLNLRPRGSLIQTSRGTGLVCDTGTFIYSNRYQLDVATTW